MKRRWTWAIGAGLVAAAWGVGLVTPSEDIATAAFPVATEIGKPADARGFTATITDVRLTDRAVAGGWFAEGTWLLVDVEAAATRTEEGTNLSGVTFTLGDRTYRASERPDTYVDALFTAPLAVGLAREGTVGFELPEGASGIGTIRLSLDPDTRLDSVIEVRVDLDTLEHLDESEFLETEWAP